MVLFFILLLVWTFAIVMAAALLWLIFAGLKPALKGMANYSGLIWLAIVISLITLFVAHDDRVTGWVFVVMIAISLIASHRK